MAIAPVAPGEKKEEKPQGGAPAPAAGGAAPAPGQAAPPANPPAPPAPPAAPVETPEQKAERLEKELRERDGKIQDLSTTIATIEQRQRQLETQQPPQGDELQKELEAIEELRLTDPAAAAKKNAELLRKISDTAAQRAQSSIAYQTVIDKLRAGVKAENPDFDEDVLDYVMERADKLATTGKFKTAEEAVKAATTLVKSKFEGYAQKRNATPPLPPGALAENGGNPPPAPEPKDTPLPTAAEEIGQRKDALQRKII